MEYKKCEHCGEKIHIRSKKCPFCNQTVAEVPEEVIKEDEVENENIEEIENKEEENPNELEEENQSKIDDSFIGGESTTVFWEKTNNSRNYDPSDPSKVNIPLGPNGEPKDYIYKAEVRHSLQYTTPMSNLAKVFIAALCTIPVMGQLIGIFLGVFFSTYDEYDKRSFGKALIFLSIFMFAFYLLYIKWALRLIGSVDINSLLQ